MKITITLDTEDSAEIEGSAGLEALAFDNLSGEIRNMVRDALAEFNSNRCYASENMAYARAYVDKRYPDPSPVFRTAEDRERKAQRTHDRCRLAQMLKSSTLTLED